MRVHSLQPTQVCAQVAPSVGVGDAVEDLVVGVGDAVEAHYGTDEDELWWPATNPQPNPSLGLSLSLSLTLTQTP